MLSTDEQTKKQKTKYNMEKTNNKYIAVSYKLFSKGPEGDTLVEEAAEERPFQFISGMGIALEEFERQIVALSQGDTYDFTLDKDHAYGDYEEGRVLDLERSIFCVNGHFDHDNIYVDAIVPLQNEDGDRFYGRVVAVGDDTVRMDLNHPLAGKTLRFVGKVVESRDATDEEIHTMIERMSGGCHCHHGKDCDCQGDEDCHCENHHHHHGDCGCGHCH